MEIEPQKAFAKRQHMRQTFCFCSQSSIEEFDTGTHLNMASIRPWLDVRFINTVSMDVLQKFNTMVRVEGRAGLDCDSLHRAFLFDYRTYSTSHGFTDHPTSEEKS